MPFRADAHAALTAATLALLLMLQGCGTTKPAARPTSPPAAATATPPAPTSVPAAAPSAATPQAGAPAAAAAPRSGALVVERQWLQSWFNGTPVRIAQQGEGPVAIDVPQEFCFDAGRSAVKPPLAAVLDKLAQSLRRTPAARLPLLAAPADVPAVPGLALQRATQMRTHLLSRGVRAGQLGTPSAATVASAQMRMELANP